MTGVRSGDEGGSITPFPTTRKGAAFDAIIGAGRRFESPDAGRYVLRHGSAVIEIDYLRREAGQLKGELQVRCDHPTARTTDGVVLISDLNLSASRTRAGISKDLAELAPGGEGAGIDWRGLIEEFAMRVLIAERKGSPAQLLHEIEEPRDDSFRIEGLRLYSTAPTILFGDGGTCKSYLGLYLAGHLARTNHSVAYFDWELDGASHKKRLRQMFGADLPRIHYARCDRALVYEVERLRRIVRDNRVNYVVLDSIAFACDGAPESAEVAVRYGQSLRRLGEIGSLHLAHITKHGETNDLKPFGSAFWHNMGRDTWNVKLAESLPGDPAARIALHNRKANLGAKAAPVGYEFQFGGERTDVRQLAVEDDPGLAVGLTVAQRMFAVLRHGPLSIQTLAGEIDAQPDTVAKTARRNPTKFRMDAGRVSILETRQ